MGRKYLSEVVKIMVWVSCCSVVPVNSFAQSVELRSGSNLMPGNYFSIGYEHTSNWPLNFAGKLFTEGSHTKGLQYKAYGIDLLVEYGSNQNDYSERIFALRMGLGATCQIESEPWVYRNLPANKRRNYGLVGVVSGEWWMSENFCLSVFGQQKYLFNSSLGSARCAMGMGLKFRLTND